MTGRSWTQGSHVLADEVAHLDHPIIERIQAAGGVDPRAHGDARVLLRRLLPHRACGASPATRGTATSRPAGRRAGRVRRWPPGYAPLATGSDIGGSIRIPSSLSGVVGFKPPFGRVPALPPYNLDQFCHDGPMARSVADVALIQNVIAGPHWRDTASLRFPPVLPAEPRVDRGRARGAVRAPGRLADGARGRLEHAPSRRVVGCGRRRSSKRSSCHGRPNRCGWPRRRTSPRSWAPASPPSMPSTATS